MGSFCELGEFAVGNFFMHLLLFSGGLSDDPGSRMLGLYLVHHFG